jgi:hypothetical protein
MHALPQAVQVPQLAAELAKETAAASELAVTRGISGGGGQGADRGSGSHKGRERLLTLHARGASQEHASVQPTPLPRRQQPHRVSSTAAQERIAVQARELWQHSGIEGE